MMPKLFGISGSLRPKIYRILLAMIVHKPVPESPGRCEPRVRKRRQSSLSSHAAASFFPTSADGERLIKLERIRQQPNCDFG